MPWHFVDGQGREGWVGEDLSVDYAGEANIEELVERCADGVDDSSRDPVQRVMIELYATGSIRMVERVERGGDGTDETVRVESDPTTDRSAHVDGDGSK